MTRLTDRNKHGNAFYPNCFDGPCQGNGCKVDCCDFDAKACEKLCEYEELEAQRKLIRVPAGIGDNVFDIIEETVPEHFFYISTSKIKDVSAKGFWYADDCFEEWENVGNGIFLDWEEAGKEAYRLNERLKEIRNAD